MSSRIDGKIIARAVLDELKIPPGLGRLVVITVGDDSQMQKFVARKQAVGKEIGVEVIVHALEESVTQEELINLLSRLGDDATVTGVIVQLPLPTHVNKEAVLAAILPEKDIDALGLDPKVLAPVAGATQEIFARSGISWVNKKITIVGYGSLVGKPIALWLASQGVEPKIADSQTKDLSLLTKEADIIISGVGNPHCVKPDMIKEGAILIDAGTSELKGAVAGDIDPACYPKASFYTPVPGGMGPITVALIFKNLIALNNRK